MADDKSKLHGKAVGSAFMVPPPTSVLGLLDWLQADQRQDIPFLPRRYVSVMGFLPRFCAYRLPSGERLTPWLQDEIEGALRQALSDGDVVAWLLLDGCEPTAVPHTSWLNESVWHRAKFNQDRGKPVADYDGEEVSEEAWRVSERAAGPPGIYALSRNDVLAWLGVSAPVAASSPAVAHGPATVANRDAELARLRAALVIHLEFDSDHPPWVREKEFVNEILEIFRTHRLNKFIRDARRLADEIRPEAHKRRGNRSRDERTEMTDWLQRMAKKRQQFSY